VNVTVIVQVPPAASEEGQLLVCEKSAAFRPVMLIEVIVSAVFCAFVNVVGSGLLELPTATVPKLNERGEKVTGLTPVPFTRIFCGLLAALSEIVTVPDFVPRAVGEKVTVILHFAPAAIEVPQVFT
jgi:hypothetical protein